MKRCAFLSMDNPDGFGIYDELLYQPFFDLGWKAETVSWSDAKVNWNDFDVVLIRSPWDYFLNADKFLQTLETIDASSAKLENKIDLVKWNIDKTYLRDLHDDGFQIVPTLWKDSLIAKEIPDLFNELNSEELVIKPSVGAGSFQTFRMPKNNYKNLLADVEKAFSNRACMIQPFMKNIVSEGEFSVFFFGGKYSHAILKSPKDEDFRVQEEYGGILTKIEPEPALMAEATKIFESVSPIPLYGRVDMVRQENGFALMELELIEPSLYFNMDPESPGRFAKAFDDWMR